MKKEPGRACPPKFPMMLLVLQETSCSAHTMIAVPRSTSEIKKQKKALTLSPPNKLLSAKSVVCFNFQSVLMSLKVGENVV